MIRTTVMSALAAGLALGGLAAAGAAPAAAAAPSWQLGYYNSAHNKAVSELTAVSTSSTHNVWAVGSRPDVLRWNGTGWHPVTSPDFHTKNLVRYSAVSTASVSDTWVAGGTTSLNRITGGKPVHAIAAHWYRGRWFNHVLGQGGDISQVSVFARNDVWLLGTVGKTGAYWHWNGKAWSQGTLPAVPTGRSDDPRWVGASTSTGRGALLHYYAGRWHAVTSLRVTLPKNASTYYVGDVVQRSADDVFAAIGYKSGSTSDSGVYIGLSLYHWNGRTWTRQIYLHDDAAGSMTNDGSGGLWVNSHGGFGTERVVDIRSGRVVRAGNTPHFHGGALYISRLTLRPGSRTLWAVGTIEKDITDEDIEFHAAVATLAAS